MHDLIIVVLTLGLTYLLLKTFSAVSQEYFIKFLAKLGLVPTPPTT